MPCLFCNRVYRKNPCIRNGYYDSEPSIKDPWYSYYNGAEIKKLVSTFLLLHGDCPCESCLVKVMCVRLCEEYKYRTINPIEGEPNV